MDTITNKRLIVYYSGWMECNPEKTKFQYIGPEQYGLMSTGGQITGDEYMALSPEQQGDYILECLGQAYQYSVDGELMECNVEIDEI
jgi:hypothetical protein